MDAKIAILYKTTSFRSYKIKIQLVFGKGDGHGKDRCRIQYVAGWFYRRSE
jgi:hypothetical protein